MDTWRQSTFLIFYLFKLYFFVLVLFLINLRSLFFGSVGFVNKDYQDNAVDNADIKFRK